jgi:hypothetical protein
MGFGCLIVGAGWGALSARYIGEADVGGFGCGVRRIDDDDDVAFVGLSSISLAVFST